MPMNNGLALACILIPAVVLIICLVTLCAALNRFLQKNQHSLDIEKSVIFDLEYATDDCIEETAV